MNSRLQIFSGRFRGRKLFLPPDARPTQNRARMALFNILGGLIGADENIVVWDAFAGSGAFGIECLSRYPGARVYFTDVATTSVQTVRKNLAMLQVGNVAVVEQIDANMAVKRIGGIADLIFVDAPYDDADVGFTFVRALGKRAKSGAILIWEQETSHSVNPPDGWKILRDKVYGRARFLILQRCGE